MEWLILVQCNCIVHRKIIERIIRKWNFKCSSIDNIWKRGREMMLLEQGWKRRRGSSGGQSFCYLWHLSERWSWVHSAGYGRGVDEVFGSRRAGAQNCNDSTLSPRIKKSIGFGKSVLFCVCVVLTLFFFFFLSSHIMFSTFSFSHVYLTLVHVFFLIFILCVDRGGEESWCASLFVALCVCVSVKYIITVCVFIGQFSS